MMDLLLGLLTLWTPYIQWLGLVFACVVVVMPVITSLQKQQKLTPDGAMYLGLLGSKMPPPYSLRWLLPWALRQSTLTVWNGVTFCAIVVTGLSLAYIAAYVTSLPLTFAVPLVLLILIGLPIVRLNLRYQALNDVPALAIAATAVAFGISGHVFPALLLTVIGVTLRETVPLWVIVSLWCFNPTILTLPVVLLLGGTMILPLLRYFQTRRIPIPLGYEWLKSPMRSALHHQWQQFEMTHGLYLLSPWGICLLPFFTSGVTLPLMVGLVLGYGPLLVANDSARIYQFMSIILIPLTLNAIASLPLSVSIILLLLHLQNSWRDYPV